MSSDQHLPIFDFVPVDIPENDERLIELTTFRMTLSDELTFGTIDDFLETVTGDEHEFHPLFRHKVEDTFTVKVIDAKLNGNMAVAG